MSSLLIPISQMTRGQHVFGACMIARSLYSVIKASVNAYKTSDCDNRIKYIALACLEALNAGFKSIAFLGYVTGNIPLMALGSVLTVIFLAIILKVEKTIKSEEMPVIQSEETPVIQFEETPVIQFEETPVIQFKENQLPDCGRNIYIAIQEEIEKKKKGEGCIFNEQHDFVKFLRNLNSNYGIKLSLESKNELESTFIKYQKFLAPNIKFIPLTSPLCNNTFKAFYNDIKALEEKYPVNVR